MKHQNSYDLLIVGGGVFGLWSAKRAVEAGLSVCLVEKRTIGAGASGGVLGALMPHLPTRWIEKKQFQYEALVDLETECAALEEATGKKTGYGRIGRLMPVRTQLFLDVAAEREEGAKQNWHGYTFSYKKDVPDWVSRKAAPYGVVHDTFAARLHPRDMLQALVAWLTPHVTFVIGQGVEEWTAPTATLSNGEKLTAAAILYCNGYETFDYIHKAQGLDLGSGIKGQAALFDLGEAVKGHCLPVLYDDGCYVVPHHDGTVAVGSTSEKTWKKPHTFDKNNISFIQKARAFCPYLEGLEPVSTWAAVRPKCYKREPIIGCLNEEQNVYIATGGFKISFSIAHRAAQAIIHRITKVKNPLAIPQSFEVEWHTS